MKHIEIIEALKTLNRLNEQIDTELIESEGEVTEEIVTDLEAKEALAVMLTTEGADSLGQWLKALEDKKEMHKAERDYAARQVNKCDSTINYVRGLLNEVMVDSDITEIKGAYGYKFKVGTKTETTVDKDIIKSRYQECIEEAAHNIGVPADITITLGASISKVADDEPLPDYYTRTVTGKAGFTKPRASKAK